MTDQLGIGIIGFGFMGRTHLSAYQEAARSGSRCRVVAIADRSGVEFRAEGNLEIAAGATLDGIRVSDDSDSLLADPAVHAVSICTHTDTHVELTRGAIDAGKHVLVEKPIATRSADVRALADAINGSDRVCLPAMCMRFWPAWAWLRSIVQAGEFGPVRSATFHRLGSRPAWGDGFYADTQRSGGALTDLHIHDTDFIAHCFGIPDAVMSTGSVDHLTTQYRYDNGPAHVVAEGGWGHQPGFGFTMRFVVCFENATADFELGRDPELRLHRADTTETIPLDPWNGYVGEIRHFVELATGGLRRDQALATIDDAARIASILEDEQRSLHERRPITTSLGGA